MHPDTRTDEERRYRRRRWGAIGVVAAVSVLGLASLFASSSSSASASEADPAEARLVETPLAFGTSAFVPPSFALPERERAQPSPPPPFAALVLPPPPPPAQAPLTFRAALGRRLAVRDDPYARPSAPPVIVRSFTHPGKLPEKSRARAL